MRLAKALCSCLSKDGIQNRADVDNTSTDSLFAFLNLASTVAVVNKAGIYQVPKAVRL